MKIVLFRFQLEKPAFSLLVPPGIILATWAFDSPVAAAFVAVLLGLVHAAGALLVFQAAKTTAFGRQAVAEYVKEMQELLDEK